MKLRPVHFILFGIVVGLGGFFLILANPFGKNLIPTLNTNKTTSSEPALPAGVKKYVPSLTLPKGRQIYNVSGQDTNISEVKQIIIDPLDIKKGGTQTIDIKTTSPEDIATVETIIASDNETKTVKMTLKSGTPKDGVWSGQTTYTDTAETNYFMTFVLTTINKNKSEQPFAIR